MNIRIILLLAALSLTGAGCTEQHQLPPAPSIPAIHPIDPFWKTCKLKEIILSFPAYALHEESVAEFRQDIENAAIEKDPETGKEYLEWPGDGCFASATYILDKTGQTLYIVRHYNGFELIPGSWCVPYKRANGAWRAEEGYPASGKRPHERIDGKI